MGDNLPPSLDGARCFGGRNTVIKEKNVFETTYTNKKLIRIVPHPRKRFNFVSVEGNNNFLVIFSIHSHESKRGKD